MFFGIRGRRFDNKALKGFHPESLLDRIEIQSKTKVRDDWGQSEETWATTLRLSANVLFVNGKTYNQELVMADKFIASNVASIRIRSGPTITTEMRVKFKGVFYNINAVLPNTKEGFIDLAVEAGKNNG